MWRYDCRSGPAVTDTRLLTWTRIRAFIPIMEESGEELVHLLCGLPLWYFPHSSGYALSLHDGIYCGEANFPSSITHQGQGSPWMKSFKLCRCTKKEAYKQPSRFSSEMALEQSINCIMKWRQDFYSYNNLPIRCPTHRGGTADHHRMWDSLWGSQMLHKHDWLRAWFSIIYSLPMYQIASMQKHHKILSN